MWKLKLKQVFTQNPNNFLHVDGIRAISCLLVITYHILTITTFYISEQDLLLLLNNHGCRIIASMDFILEPFFVVSGFVVGYLLLYEYNNTGKIDIYGFLKRRLIRIYPLYMVIMILAVPIYFKKVCNVWSNILFINNFLHTEEQYLSWCWTIGLEFQFYIIIGIILPFILNLRNKFFIIMIFIVPLVIIPFITIYAGYIQLNAGLISQDITNATSIYFNFCNKTYIRIWSCWLGLGVAYLYTYYKFTIESNLNLIKNLFYILLFLFLIIYYIFYFYNQQILWEVYQNFDFTRFILQWMCLHYLWAILTIFVIILGFYPSGLYKHIINFLKLRLWHIISELSYAAYLIHPIVISVVLCKYVIDHETIGLNSMLQQGYVIMLLVFSISLLLVVFIEPKIKMYLIKLKENILNFAIMIFKRQRMFDL